MRYCGDNFVIEMYKLIVYGQNSTIFFYGYNTKMQQKKEEGKDHRHFMNRNVTEFRHIMKHSYITENDLSWVINLRDNNIPKNIEAKESSPPEVFFKKTAVSDFKVYKKEAKSVNKIRPNQYDHFYLKSKDQKHQTQNPLNFYSSLRTDKWKTETVNTPSHKSFVNFPYKDRGANPKFLKKVCFC